MAQLADTHKVMARMELERLHKGLVVELDKKLTRTAAEERIQPASEVADVPLAIRVVQDTVAALADLRTLSANQRSALAENEESRTRLSAELDASNAKIADLGRDIEGLRSTISSLEQQVERLEGDKRTLGDGKAKVEEDLRMIIASIISSFSPAKGEGEERHAS